MLVLYPLIDAVASLLDARNQHGSIRWLLIANAAVSTVAAVALGVAARHGLTPVFVVFGIWAGPRRCGAARRRPAPPRPAKTAVADAGRRRGVRPLRRRLHPMAATGHAVPAMIVVYAATGGADFVIQALLLRRRRLAATADPIHGAR